MKPSENKSNEKDISSIPSRYSLLGLNLQSVLATFNVIQNTYDASFFVSLPQHELRSLQNMFVQISDCVYSVQQNLASAANEPSKREGSTFSHEINELHCNGTDDDHSVIDNFLPQPLRSSSIEVTLGRATDELDNEISKRQAPSGRTEVTAVMNKSEHDAKNSVTAETAKDRVTRNVMDYHYPLDITSSATEDDVKKHLIISSVDQLSVSKGDVDTKIPTFAGKETIKEGGETMLRKISQQAGALLSLSSSDRKSIYPETVPPAPLPEPHSTEFMEIGTIRSRQDQENVVQKNAMKPDLNIKEVWVKVRARNMSRMHPTDRHGRPST